MKRIIQVAGVLIAILAVLAISLPALISPNQFRPRIEAELSSALGRHVSLGDLSLSLFSGRVSARDLVIAEDERFGTDPFVRARSLDLGVELWPLLTARKLIITNFTITAPELSLLQDRAGVWNLSTLGSKRVAAQGAGPSAQAGSPLDLSAKALSIVDGRLLIGRTGGVQKPAILDHLNISVKDFSEGVQFPFSVTAGLGMAGKINLAGMAGPINRTDASLTPVQVSVKISGVDLAASGATAGAGLGGVLSIEGSASMNGPALDWKGLVHLDQAKLAPHGTPAKQPAEFDFAVRHNLQEHSGVLSQGKVRLGAAPASLTGSYEERGNATIVNLRLTGSAMPLSALTGMLPPLDIQLPSGSSLEGGTASVNVTITGPAAGPVVAGTVTLNDTKLKGFDLGSKVSAIERIAGIQPARDTIIQTLSATLRSDTNGTTIRDLKFVAPAIGELDGAGSVSEQHALDFKMLATVHTQGALMGALGQRHDTSIPFYVEGTSANPVFKPDVAGIAAAEAQRLGGGKKIGGIDVGQALSGIFGGKKKK